MHCTQMLKIKVCDIVTNEFVLHSLFTNDLCVCFVVSVQLIHWV